MHLAKARLNVPEERGPGPPFAVTVPPAVPHAVARLAHIASASTVHRSRAPSWPGAGALL